MFRKLWLKYNKSTKVMLKILIFVLPTKSAFVDQAVVECPNFTNLISF